jgi:tripartite-type tricarboxylate transporter receptor subunit TctC
VSAFVTGGTGSQSERPLVALVTAEQLPRSGARPCCRTFPTIAEAGVPGYWSTIWLGLMAPAGIPQAIVDKLNVGINQVIDRPDVKEAWERQGALPLKLSPAEFDKFLRADIEKWAHVIKVSGMQMQ